MKKLKLIILGLGMLISLAVYGNNIDIASAAENETSTQTDDTTTVPSDVQSAVDNLLNNYTNDNINVTDASFSKPTLAATDGTYSLSDFSKIPVMKNYILKEGSDSLSSQLNDVKFHYYGHYPISGFIDFTYRISIDAMYNGKKIGTKTISVNDQFVRDRFTKATQQEGVVTATHEEGSSYAPLLDTANQHSTRSLAPDSGWYTDKIMVDMQYGTVYYRVSNTEWVNEYFVKPHADTSLQIADPISSGKDRDISISFRAISGEPVYKSNGELWNYALPNNSSWEITRVAFDQYGVAYGEVSTGAWVRYTQLLH